MSGSIDQKWQDSYREAFGPKAGAWNEHDRDLFDVVKGFNAHNQKTPTYKKVDWQLLKAMAWLESGGPEHRGRAWNSALMQITPLDPGLAVALSGVNTELHGPCSIALAMTPSQRQKITVGLVTPPTILRELRCTSHTAPRGSICLAAVYLWTQMAQLLSRLEIDADRETRIDVAAGDTYAGLAKRHGSLPDVLMRLNPDIPPQKLRPGQQLRIQPARTRWEIRRWQTFSYANIARQYNGGGDPAYAAKLTYLHQLILHPSSATSARRSAPVRGALA